MRALSASDDIRTSPRLSADAELIRVCAEHVLNMDTFNEAEADPGRRIWAAYSQTRDFISAAKPQTLAGVLAKAKAAHHKAGDSNGDECWSGTMGEGWACDIVNDLLRVTGGVA